MQHFAVNDRRYYPLFEEIAALGAAVMIDVGTTGMGAGMPGGMGARIRHAHPVGDRRSRGRLSRTLKIIMAHPGWPWVDETTAVALHKGNVYWEMSGWAPKYFPGNLKVDMRARLQDKIMFGSDYPSMPYERILHGVGRARLQGRGHGEDLPRERGARPRPVNVSCGARPRARHYNRFAKEGRA